jgi:hypothetical protein
VARNENPLLGPKILKCRSAALFSEGDITNAIHDFTNYEELISDNVEKEKSYIMLGIMLWIDKKTEKADAYFEKGIKMDSDHKFTIFANQFLSEVQTNQDLPQLRKSLIETFQKSFK